MYCVLFDKTQIVLSRIREIANCAVAECVAASGENCGSELKTT
jgi:hypothetical protein